MRHQGTSLLQESLLCGADSGRNARQRRRLGMRSINVPSGRVRVRDRDRDGVFLSAVFAFVFALGLALHFNVGGAVAAYVVRVVLLLVARQSVDAVHFLRPFGL